MRQLSREACLAERSLGVSFQAPSGFGQMKGKRDSRHRGMETCSFGTCKRFSIAGAEVVYSVDRNTAERDGQVDGS